MYRVNTTVMTGVQRKYYCRKYINTTAMTGVQRKYYCREYTE